jgi:hypothetical protein
MEDTRIRNGTVVGSVILTVAAIIASWPATAFLLMYYRQPQDTGALMVGGFFSLLAVVLWGSAGWVGQSSIKLESFLLFSPHLQRLLTTKKNQ